MSVIERPSISSISRVRVHGGDRIGRHVLAIAKHRDAVAQRKNFAEPVRHIDHRTALLAHIVEHAEDARDLGVGQRRRGLVENEDAGIARE